MGAAESKAMRKPLFSSKRTSKVTQRLASVPPLLRAFFHRPPRAKKSSKSTQISNDDDHYVGQENDKHLETTALQLNQPPERQYLHINPQRRNVLPKSRSSLGIVPMPVQKNVRFSEDGLKRLSAYSSTYLLPAKPYSFGPRPVISSSSVNGFANIESSGAFNANPTLNFVESFHREKNYDTQSASQLANYLAQRDGRYLGTLAIRKSSKMIVDECSPSGIVRPTFSRNFVVPSICESNANMLAARASCHLPEPKWSRSFAQPANRKKSAKNIPGSPGYIVYESKLNRNISKLGSRKGNMRMLTGCSSGILQPKSSRNSILTLPQKSSSRVAMASASLGRFNQKSSQHFSPSIKQVRSRKSLTDLLGLGSSLVFDKKVNRHPPRTNHEAQEWIDHYRQHLNKLRLLPGYMLTDNTQDRNVASSFDSGNFGRKSSSSLVPEIYRRPLYKSSWHNQFKTPAKPVIKRPDWVTGRSSTLKPKRSGVLNVSHKVSKRTLPTGTTESRYSQTDCTEPPRGILRRTISEGIQKDDDKVEKKSKTDVQGGASVVVEMNEFGCSIKRGPGNVVVKSLGKGWRPHCRQHPEPKHLDVDNSRKNWKEERDMKKRDELAEIRNSREDEMEHFKGKYKDKHSHKDRLRHGEYLRHDNEKRKASHSKHHRDGHGDSDMDEDREKHRDYHRKHYGDGHNKQLTDDQEKHHELHRRHHGDGHRERHINHKEKLHRKRHSKHRKDTCEDRYKDIEDKRHSEVDHRKYKVHHGKHGNGHKSLNGERSETHPKEDVERRGGESHKEDDGDSPDVFRAADTRSSFLRKMLSRTDDYRTGRKEHARHHHRHGVSCESESSGAATVSKRSHKHKRNFEKNRKRKVEYSTKEMGRRRK